MKRFLLPSLLTAVLLIAVGCVGNSPENTLLKGLEAYRDGDWWGAIHYFKDYLEKWPQHSMHNEALFYLADCNFNADQKKQAEDYFRQFLSAAPDHPFANRSRLSLAMILDERSHNLEKEGKKEEAQAAWQEAQTLLGNLVTLTDPQLVILVDQATVYLANAQFIHGNTEETVSMYERRRAKAERGMARAAVDSASPSIAAGAIADPTDAIIWFQSLQQLAALHSLEHDWEKARACYGEVLSATFLPPDVRLKTYLEVAATYRQENRVDDASKVYQDMYETLSAEQVEMATTLKILSKRFIADTLISAGSPENATPYLNSVFDFCKGIYQNAASDREMAVYAGVNMAEIELIRGATDAAENTLTQVLLDHPSTRLTPMVEQKLRALREIRAGDVAGATGVISPATTEVPGAPVPANGVASETVEAASP